MTKPETQIQSEILKEKPILPDSGEYAMVAMRYKDVELAICMKPEHMECCFLTSVDQLRKVVLEQQQLRQVAE
jgi:hypothetical protein